MENEKNLSEEQLGEVAGGIGNVDTSGSRVRGDQSITEYHEQNTNIGGDVIGGDKTGRDKVGGNKAEVDVKSNVNVTNKKSLF